MSANIFWESQLKLVFNYRRVRTVHITLVPFWSIAPMTLALYFVWEPLWTSKFVLLPGFNQEIQGQAFLLPHSCTQTQTFKWFYIFTNTRERPFRYQVLIFCIKEIWQNLYFIKHICTTQMSSSAKKSNKNDLFGINS